MVININDSAINNALFGKVKEKKKAFRKVDVFIQLEMIICL